MVRNTKEQLKTVKWGVRFNELCHTQQEALKNFAHSVTDLLLGGNSNESLEEKVTNGMNHLLDTGISATLIMTAVVVGFAEAQEKSQEPVLAIKG
ncbi:hypothetical protein HY439_01120 [Candidatus Microgenomates bacterium]|nr:hypothetical protein [Candidatus Microgenomates bacterium]